MNSNKLWDEGDENNSTSEMETTTQLVKIWKNLVHVSLIMVFF